MVSGYQIPILRIEGKQSKAIPERVFPLIAGSDRERNFSHGVSRRDAEARERQVSDIFNRKSTIDNIH